MSQEDYNVANSDGATFRADLNNQLAAIATLNSGATAPTTTFAFMLWPDTANSLLKQRNAANSAWVTLGPLASLFSSPGKQTIGVAGGGIKPTTTAGCAEAAQAETTSNKINYEYLAFDEAAEEKGFFWFPTPKSYNASTFTLRAVWTHPATATNFDVVWEFEMLSLADGDAIDAAVGTAITVTDTGGTTEDFYTSPESAAVTASGTPAKQDWIYCQISRKAADGSDNLAVDAHLIGVEVYYTTNAGNDA